MAILTVGPNSTYPTISQAMQSANANDTIQLEAGYGNESALVTRSGMTFFGGATSTDIFLQLATGITTVTLTGTAPIEVRDASDGNTIVGNAGNNTITVTDGADAVNGGLGTDRLVVDYRLATGAITGDSTSSITEAGGSHAVTITSNTFEHFTILTGSGADTITTGAGDDIIRTGNGAGTVTAGQGANSIIGGSDADTITALDGGNFIDGGNGKNTLTSGGGNDVIRSGTGADTIVAGGGNDQILVRGGADTSESGAGRDRLTVDYSAMTTAVTGGVTGGTLSSGYSGQIKDTVGNKVDFYGTEDFTVTTGSGGDNIKTGDGADTINGGAGNDVLSGQAGTDLLQGGLGNDTVNGGTSADQMTGGLGSDTFYVQNTGDKVFELNETGFDRVNSSVTFSLAGQYIEMLDLTGAANANGTGNSLTNTLFGNEGRNTLSGLSANDTLNGGTGIDRLIGGTGSDKLTGGADADTFVFALHDAGITSSTADTITDWSTADSIDTLITGTSGNYIEASGSSTTISDAAAFAESRATNATAHVFVYNTGGDIGFLLSDLDNNDTFETGVILTGRGSAAEFSYADLI